jgi:hypothetical protein
MPSENLRTFRVLDMDAHVPELSSTDVVVRVADVLAWASGAKEERRAYRRQSGGTRFSPHNAGYMHALDDLRALLAPDEGKEEHRG